ncbi:tetratricopeptide repeat protein [Crocinitomix catalasitica]|uniref:tetratricopeptide repeat protein n=1 Tax=Crocinitomix catalasitica TaxID=184607 RepID=UPI00047F7B5F|nr:tetratricopeptide repeat protein [Crocinitomix catalasitica]
MFEEEDDNGFFDDSFDKELKRYEEMINAKNVYYFDPEILEQIIEHFIIKNQLKKGLKAIAIAKDLHPSYIIYDLRKAQIYSTNGQLKESLQILMSLEKIDPFNAEIFITKASVFSQLRDHVKAIKYYEKAIEVSNDDEFLDELEDIRFDLAMEYENMHNYQSAIKVLSEILENNPQNEAAIYEIAYCYERIGNFDKCITFYNKYIDNNPYSFTAWYNLGNIYFLKNNIEKALWAYDYAIVINEEFASAHFNMGNTYMQIQEFDKALEAYQKCVEIDGDDALTISYLAEAYERLERYDEALKYYEKSKDLNPSLAEPWLGIGIIHDLKDDTHQAISYLQQAVTLQPENANFRVVLGEALFKLERLTEAETQLERALQLDPTYSEAIVLLGQIKAEFSLSEALDFILNFENIKSLDSSVRLFLSSILWKTGKKMESLLLFKKEFLIDPNSAKTLLLYLPEAENIADFAQIIENQ